MFGSHLSVAGGMHHAVDEAVRLGLDALQVFTKNQQQWQVKPLEPDSVVRWKQAVHHANWGPGASPGAGRERVVSHASYLINLASPDDVLWRKSIEAMAIEIQRCDALGIGLLVHHPGSTVGGELNAGIARIGAAYQEIYSLTPRARVISCLEATVGAGSTIGGRFEHLRDLRIAIGGLEPRWLGGAGPAGERLAERLGVCIDTCHIHAAGYDISTAAKGAAVIDELDAVVGLGRVRVLHFNDSKGKVGSKLDRHEHIGRGTIGLEGFGPFVNHPGLRQAPMILETPKEEIECDGRMVAADLVNVSLLRSLVSG